MLKFSLLSARRAAWTREVRPVFERFAFVVYLGTFVGSCGLVGLGLIFALLLQEVRPLCVGLAGGALARILQQHGYRAWNFARWEDTFEPSDAAADFGEDPVRSERAAQLEVLLSQLDAGGATREVWAVQEIRHRARALLAAEPALREAYAARLAEHPELS